MAIAAFQLMKCTGTNAATETDCSWAPNFLSSDSATDTPSSKPVAVPLSGSDNTSYELWLRLKCTTAPDNYCQNFKVFGPNLQPDYPANKVKIKMGTTGTAATPVQTTSSVATTQADTNYYSSASGLTIGVVPGDSKINAINEYTNYLVQQLFVSPGAARGDLVPQAFYWQYEET